MWKMRILAVLLVQMISGFSGFAEAGSSKGAFRSAFDDITSDAKYIHGSLMDYESVLSLNGMMPLQLPGMYFEDPIGEVRSGNASPSLMTGISPKMSFRVVQTFDPVYLCENKSGNTDQKCSEVDAKEIAARIRNAYLRVRPLTVQLVALRIKHALAESLRMHPENKKAAKIVADALDLKITDGKVAPDDLDQKIRKLDGYIKTAKGKLDAANETLNTLSGASNVIVTRWTKGKKSGGSLGIGSFAGAGGSSQATESGILILAGIRTISLHAGEDFVDMLKDSDDSNGLLKKDYFSKIGIVTYVLQAKALCSISEFDAERALQIHLNLSRKTFKDALAIAKISVDIDAYIASATNLFSSSSVSSPKTVFQPYCFTPEAHRKMITGLPKALGDSQAECSMDDKDDNKNKTKTLIEKPKENEFASHFITVFSVKANLKQRIVDALARKGGR